MQCLSCKTKQCGDFAYLNVVVLHFNHLLQKVDSPPSACLAVENEVIVQKIVKLVADDGSKQAEFE